MSDQRSNPVTNVAMAAEQPMEHFDDDRMELIMGWLLQVGVLLASIVVLIGGILYLYTYRASPVDLRQFPSEPVAFRNTAALFRDTRRGDPGAIIEIGILLLIATPIARVIFAGIAFAYERDRFYVAISLVILMVLLMGFLHSH
jgi:uncharacterized membrane protein